MTDRVVPTRVRSTAVYEAWQVTEDNIDALAVQLKGTVVRDFTGRPAQARLEVGGISVEVGDYLLCDPTGAYIGMWESTYVTRYKPLTTVELIRETQDAIDSLHGKDVTVKLTREFVARLTELGLWRDGKQVGTNRQITDALVAFGRLEAA